MTGAERMVVMNSKKLVFIAMAAILALSALPLVSAMPSDSNISSSWATTTPTIDGYISPDEWTDATPVDITNEASYIVVMYVKNDGNKLYLAFEDPNDPGTSTQDCVLIHFDDEPISAHNGLWDYTSCPSGEGYLVISYPENKFVGIIAGPEFCDYVIPALGVNSNTSIIEHVRYEVAIDLSTSALKGSPGDEIGVYIKVWDFDDTGFLNGQWPDTGIGEDPSTYGNLTLATGESPNRHPVADAGPDQIVREGQLVTLNGTASFDLDGDPLTYSWKQFSGPRQTLIGANTTRPTFTPKNVYPRHNVSVFKLIVDDGKGGRDIDNVTITVISNPPRITSFDPTKGWAGNDVTITGTELGGSDIYIGGVKTGRVNGPYDNQYTFGISPDVPYGRSPITVRTWIGESTSSDEIEVFVRPDYCLRWGFAFDNPSQDLLTYPHLPWDEGSYKDTFGEDQVYTTIWVCAGLPVCVPYAGCWCAGYEIEEPICPDPLAEIYYGAAYWHLARPGECFGMSANSLQFYNGDLDPGDFSVCALNVNQLKHRGELDRRIDYMHGSQVSMECIEFYTNQALAKVALSDDPLKQRIAMRLFLEQVEDSIESGSLGIISVLDGRGHGHAVVPYLVEDVDADHTRIYVYDSNREQFSEKKTAINALINSSDVYNNYPPYIEIDKSGVYWSWFFERDYGDKWDGYFLIFFLPYNIVNGDRTLPSSWKGMLDFIVGDATSQIEDESGRSLGVDEHGELLIEIPNAIPMPGTEGKGYALPLGNYTTHIQGQTDGTYNWSAFSNGSAFAIQGADVTTSTADRIVLNYEDNNPLTGLMSFETSDATKKYSAILIKKFKEQSVERIYRVKNTRISQGSAASFEVSPNFDSLIYTNDGPETITYDVEIQTNMVSQEVANRGPITKLPTATRNSIVIGPYEKHVLTPENWLDLNQTTINLNAIPIYRVPTLKLLGLIALLGLLSVIAVITIRRRQK